VKEYAIALYINKVTQSSFVRFGDKNNITRGIALTYFSKEGREIDTLAQEISGDMDIDVTPQDVVDFIIANPNGKRNILTVKNPTHQSLIDKFVELTGFRPTPSQIAYFKLEVKPTQIDIEFANEVEVNNKIDDDIVNKIQAQDEFDKWFSNLTQQEQVEFIEQRKKFEDSEHARRQEYAREAQEKADSIKEGSILCSSWGYEQTNIDFYKVVERKNNTIKLVEIEQVRTYSGDMQGNCTPEPSQTKGEPFTKRINKFGGVNLASYKYCSLWDGRPMSWSSYN